MEDLGFILTRHVTSDDTNRYWNECCRCIRLFYPSTPIVIVDDASDPAFVKGNLQPNCTVVVLDYPRRGELLPYLFLKKYRSFKKAVILHDSVFITAPIPTDSVTDVKFLWHFDAGWHSFGETAKLAAALPEHDLIRDIYKSAQWVGCFGVQSVITLDFLDTLPLELLVDLVHVREDRCALERVFALLCQIRRPMLLLDPSLFGDINRQPREWGYTYEQYQRHPPGTPVKVWTGR